MEMKAVISVTSHGAPQNHGRGPFSTWPAIMVPSGNSTPMRWAPPSGASCTTL